MAASTTDGALLGSRGGKLPPLAQRCGSGLMHSRAHGHLDGFQIPATALVAICEDHTQEWVYFARDFLPDRFGRFSLWRQGLFHWPSPGDLLINLQQLLTEFSKAMKSLHLAVRFAKFTAKLSLRVFPLTGGS
jgi:hypothetical protein